MDRAEVEQIALNAKKRLPYTPGDEVWIKASELKATVLKRLEPTPDEKDIGPKYLVRTEEHQMRQVFACEIELFSETG